MTNSQNKKKQYESSIDLFTKFQSKYLFNDVGERCLH